METPFRDVSGPEMDDVSPPEVGELRGRLFIEHGRSLPKVVDVDLKFSRVVTTDYRERDRVMVARRRSLSIDSACL